jgi:hypothetical protein
MRVVHGMRNINGRAGILISCHIIVPGNDQESFRLKIGDDNSMRSDKRKYFQIARR